MKKNFLSKKKIQMNTKTEVVRKVVISSIRYNSKFWILTENLKARINVMDMTFVRKLKNTTRRDTICNEVTRRQLIVEPIVDKVVEGHSPWLGHVSLMTEEIIAKRVFETKKCQKYKRGTPRRTWLEGLKKIQKRRLRSLEEEKKVPGEISVN